MNDNKKRSRKKPSETTTVSGDSNVNDPPFDNDLDHSPNNETASPLALIDRTQPNPRSPLFPIVGLGASAGGLEAIEEFFRAMPADSGMGFVVIMHQAAKHVSLLPELISKCTPMEVTAIRDRMSVHPNCVYIVPPGKNADLLNGTLYLTDLPPKHGAPLPIDYFFCSLADDRGNSAVGIVLSGTGNDGTNGVAAIKRGSGLVMVQQVESAKFSGMPENAIAAGWFDHVLTPGEMPNELTKHARGPFSQPQRSVKSSSPGIRQLLPEILLQLRRRCGHDFSGYKTSTICRRIERRMNVHQIDDPKQYLRFLDEHGPEAETLFNELLIGVTSFFRDRWTFEALVAKAINPMLLEKKHDESTFRVWVPGCATGEEAYSIAILLRECMDALKIHLNVQIFATDLDAAAIERARTGVFDSSIAADVSTQRLSQFFAKEEDKYRIRKELREWLVFAPQNVIHDPPFTKLDLVSCRNLMIYLQSDMQKKLLTLFYYSLQVGGCLFLGASEAIGDCGDMFLTLDKKAKLYRRGNSAARPMRNVEFPITAAAPLNDRRQKMLPKKLPLGPISLAIDEVLANSFAPPTVFVDDNHQIVHIHGRTGQFLEFAPGEPSQNIVTMAREGLEPGLASALRLASRQDAPVLRENILVKTNGDTTRITLSVQRIKQPESIRGLLRVSFQILSDPPPSDFNGESEGPENILTSREEELERELQHTRESLQRSIEELNASTEEMKSTNEELQSTNEELQSTNEELETSKEELQSLNEELQSINSEFQEKIHDLSQANDDMANLLNSTDIATIFLDNQLRIKRFTDTAKTVIRLIPTDVGRPLRDLTSHLKYDDLVSDAAEVLATLVFKECEVCTHDGRWLMLRILPYRTSDDRIDGLVITFIDIEKLKSFESKIQLARVQAESIVATTREPLLVLDSDFRVHSANDAFYKMFAVSSDQTIGRLVYALGNQQWNIPALHHLLEEILSNDDQVDDFEVQHDFPEIGSKHLLLNARRIPNLDGETALILLAMEEVKT